MSFRELVNVTMKLPQARLTCRTINSKQNLLFQLHLLDLFHQVGSSYTVDQCHNPDERRAEF